MFQNELDVDETLAAAAGRRRLRQPRGGRLCRGRRDRRRSKASTRSSPPSCRAARSEALERREAASREERRALGVEDALAEMPYLTEAMLVTLGKAGIKTLDDLADLATDELVAEEAPRAAPPARDRSNRPEDKGGVLAEYGLSEEQGNEIIMAARAHWFEDEAPPRGRRCGGGRRCGILAMTAARLRHRRRGAHVPSGRASCRARKGTRDELIRLALSARRRRSRPTCAPRRPGRGAWIGVDRAELDAAQRQGQAEGRARARVQDRRRSTIPADLGERIADRAARSCARPARARGAGRQPHHRLRRRSTTAARSGKVHLLLHAADAGADGAGKLDQAWRVGARCGGQRPAGAWYCRCHAPYCRWRWAARMWYMSPDRPRCRGARAATRSTAGVHFIGPDLTSEPCETASQGASALRASADGRQTTRNLSER